MKKYLVTHPMLFCLSILTAVMTQSASVAMPLVSMRIVDALTLGDMERLFSFAPLIIGVVLLMFFSTSLFGRIGSLYYLKTASTLRKDIFRSVMNRNIACFNQENSAKYISVLNNDADIIATNYFNAVIYLIKDLIMVLIAAVTMAVIQPVVAVIAAIIAAIPLAVPFIFSKRLIKTQADTSTATIELNQKTKDYLSGFEVIKSFGAENNIIPKFIDAADNQMKVKYKRSAVSTNVGSVTGSLIIAISLVNYLIAGIFVLQGYITVGAAVALVGLAANIIVPINDISTQLGNIRSSKEINRRVIEMLEMKDAKARDIVINGLSEDIELRNLSFTYENQKEMGTKDTGEPKKPVIKMIQVQPGQSVDEVINEQRALHGGELKTVANIKNMPDISALINNPELLRQMMADAQKNESPPALSNINFTFKRGGKYAIVGASGSGKSTLIKLIMGYYDDYCGELTINGNNIRDINRQSLNNVISMLHQNVFLLDDSLRNNITLYNDYSDDAYRRALKKANLINVENALPSGSDTVLGEGGNTISYGERQRVAIARAIICGSDVLILDEATANLDNIVAHDIEKEIISMEGITCIFVTHRYSRDILSGCDGILVMKDGRLAETGRFDELYKVGGYFYSLYTVLSSA
jgi:ABC-type multidrug transport system fused ATPase/permease subunit